MPKRVKRREGFDSTPSLRQSSYLGDLGVPGKALLQDRMPFKLQKLHLVVKLLIIYATFG